MTGLIRDKGFYKNLVAMALPLGLQQILFFCINMADSVMVGLLGETQLSAAALAGQPSFIYQIVCFGIASGSMVLNAQYWGKRDTDSIKRVMSIALMLVCGAAALFTSVIALFPREVMTLYASSALPEVVNEGVSYLRYMAFTYPFWGISTVLVLSMRAVENMRLSLYVSLSVLCTNVLFNYCFIFGNFGFPKMGIAGAGLATLLSRVVELGIVLVYVFVFENKLHIKFRELFRLDRVLLRDFFRVSTPVMLNEVLWSVGMSVQTMIIARVGVQMVSANSIVSTVHQLTHTFTFGIANAAAVTIGKIVGEGRIEYAKRASRTILLLSVGAGLMSMGITLGLRAFVPDVYNLTAATRELTRDMMLLQAGLNILAGVESVCIIGILRGGGDTRFALMADCLFMWTVSIPLGALTGLALHWPVVLVYLMLRSDTFIKMIACTVRVYRGRFIRDVTR